MIQKLENAQLKVEGRKFEAGGHFRQPPAENETPGLSLTVLIINATSLQQTGLAPRLDWTRH